MRARLLPYLTMLMLSLCAVLDANAQRKVSPVNTAATATQAYNEMANDSVRIRERIKASMAHYHDENGNVIYIDTITGQEWRDTIAEEKKRLPMQYPLWDAVTVGVDIWNPVMRAFGQHYGLIDFMAQLSLHNRYKPVFETGLGLANNTPAENNFTYKSPLSWYFRVGMDYNFLYNSTPDYQFFAGARIGFSTFSYSIENISINSTYWDLTANPTIPSQHSTACWWELGLGMRVKLFGPVSAGWTFRLHGILKESKSQYGKPWYIPGYGTRGQSISGSLLITYTLPISKKQPPRVVFDSDTDSDIDSGHELYFPVDSGQPSIEQINEGIDAENPE